MSSTKTVDCYQMCLAFGQNAQTLEEQLARLIGNPIELTLTNNSTSLLSVKEKKPMPRIRLHRMFLAAGDDVLSEIADYISARREKTPLFWEFVRDNRASIAEKPDRNLRMNTRGKYHDLAAMFASVNAEYFSDTLGCKITWGRRSKPTRVRQRTLGTYTLETDTIRINQILDRASVPQYYLEFIVYHEMLHAQMYREQAQRSGDITSEGKRRVVHSREFKERERLFKEYSRAMRFEQA